METNYIIVGIVAIFALWLFINIVIVIISGYISRWLGLETKQEARRSNLAILCMKIVGEIVALAILAWQFRLI